MGASSDDQLSKIVLKGPQESTITVYQHGAHVTSWTSSSGEEQLFVSRDAVFKPPKAIRGGIPVCFPQFGVLGPLSQHGFARNSPFKVVSVSDDTAVLQLEPSEEDLKKFPHPFKLIVTVKVGDDSLFQQLEVENTGSSAFDFTAALHTYLSIASIEQVRVHGLQNLRYFDNTDGVDGKLEADEEVGIKGETDRIYEEAPARITIKDYGRGKKLELNKNGFPDVVLWNPWAEKARAMSDFGDSEYKEMVCLEPALAKTGPFSLQPGERWKASQTLTASKL